MKAIPETGPCCLCSGRFDNFGNNPWPFGKTESDRCCHECNNDVLRARALLDDGPPDHYDRNADRIDGYDRDDLGESPDY